MEATKSELRMITAKAQHELSALLDTLRDMESTELDSISGWDATNDLENVRYAIDKAIDIQDTLNLL